MTKNEAKTIIESIACENARQWLAQVVRNGEVYYTPEGRNKAGDSHKFTLAVATEKHGRPALDFFWPAAVPQYSSDDPGEEARRIVGGYSAAMDVAAKAVGFNLRKRCFITGGGGMDMVYATLENLAGRVGFDRPLDVTRTSMSRVG